MENMFLSRRENDKSNFPDLHRSLISTQRDMRFDITREYKQMKNVERIRR